MSTTTNQNERSEVIELISESNQILSQEDWVIKKAGGEITVSTTSSNNKLFPDIIYYGDTDRKKILQGWEAKMPDVPINDPTNLANAEKKAKTLSLNSFIVWNFSQCDLYIENNEGEFEKKKTWEIPQIKTRNDVTTYSKEWENKLKEILKDLNNFFSSGELRQSLISEIITTSTLTALIRNNQGVIKDELKKQANINSIIDADISTWWDEVKEEYSKDESDKCSAYSKTIILNWINRITFAHILKEHREPAKEINKLNYETTPDQANKIFEEITNKCDFFNVFTPIKYNDLIPDLAWNQIIEYSNFLKENGIGTLDQASLQNIMEGTISSSKRIINGQYTTPFELAKLLSRLTILNWKDNVLDCCCGTGTIPRAVIEIKKEKFNVKEAIESTWASDKYQYPLQIANISMILPEAINIPNRLFQHDALTLNVKDPITITNPENGTKINLDIPSFGAIISNLPFVKRNNIPKEEKTIIDNLNFNSLNKRSDLYFYIALKIADMLKPGGRLGIITSNSWLGTSAGYEFIQALKKKYNFIQTHISDKGRWFQNADVVTTILILEKKDVTKPINQNATEDFILWKKSLDEFSNDPEAEKKLIQSALLSKELDSQVCTISTYKEDDINTLLNLNMSYNSLFHNINWLIKFKNITIPINQIFDVIRGSRRGWDTLFFPDPDAAKKIEPTYLQNVLLSSTSITTLNAKPDGLAFCCTVSTNYLQQNRHDGALNWIKSFENEKNKNGEPLKQVLKKKNQEWYQMSPKEKAEFVTTLNPDQRFFFAKFQKPTFINQRVIGLNHKNGYNDLDLYHALLNSVFTSFCIEAAGFGRGLGVLDLNKNKLEKCRMFNPQNINLNDRKKIIDAFKPIKQREIFNIEDELKQDDRKNFEKTVFSVFGVQDQLSNVIESLRSMQHTRREAKN